MFKKALFTFQSVILILPLCASLGFAETYAVEQRSHSRKLWVIREYKVPVQRGNPSVAGVSALMSFFGSTNWQIVKSSDFEYSLQPDKIRLDSDNRGMPRRYYELTWNAPEADEITVKQTLDVELFTFNTLYTKAMLPYPAELSERFASSLEVDERGGINPDNPALAPICDSILKKTRCAEEVVELVCDWINENITFEKGKRTSDDALRDRKGSCTPMSKLATAMLRKIGIPAEVVSAKFIGSENGHSFIEVYFPDAGWVFYDLSNWNRGYKSLDCLMTVGWSYRAGPPGRLQWIPGRFCKETDLQSFQELPLRTSKCLRNAPKGMTVSGVIVTKRKPPSSVRVRHTSIRQLIMDLSVPPGARKYKASDSNGGTMAERSTLNKVQTKEGKPEPHPKTLEEKPKRRLKSKPLTPEQELRVKLSLAENYKNSNMTQKALDIYELIIEKHPDTQAAETARKCIKQIEAADK